MDKRKTKRWAEAPESFQMIYKNFVNFPLFLLQEEKEREYPIHSLTAKTYWLFGVISR